MHDKFMNNIILYFSICQVQFSAVGWLFSKLVTIGSSPNSFIRSCNGKSLSTRRLLSASQNLKSGLISLVEKTFLPPKTIFYKPLISLLKIYFRND
jgi:hypothetical protein